MIQRAMRVYTALPVPLRSLAASMHGYYLRATRYPPRYEQLVADALERDSWDSDRWHSWQEERLSQVLHRAATRVPFYREQWQRRRRSGDRAAWDVLAHWPVLEKASLRAAPETFVADDCDLRRMTAIQTSGSTGTPLRLWWSRETTIAWYALYEARVRRWHGVREGQRWGNIGGRLVVPRGRTTPPFWVWNAGMHQLYMSSFHLAPELITFYLDAIVAYRLTFVLGYTSSLYALAQGALAAGRDDIRLKLAIANAEPVYGYQRDAIEAAFGCKLRETYGMSEIPTGASECSSGRLHLWPDAGVVEVLDGDIPVATGAVGDLICTGLTNRDMPLIRYRVGDRASLTDQTCSCGRTLPLLGQIDGRTDDVLYAADGRPVARLNHVYKSHVAIYEAQLVQRASGTLLVRYVPAPEFAPASLDSIAAELRARMGDIEIDFERLDAIPRGSNGKFRAVISEVNR